MARGSSNGRLQQPLTLSCQVQLQSVSVLTPASWMGEVHMGLHDLHEHPKGLRGSQETMSGPLSIWTMLTKGYSSSMLTKGYSLSPPRPPDVGAHMGVF